jgi:hypothetical protein
MTQLKINPAKLAQFDALTLDRSSHPSFEAGHCAMEVVAWLADEGHTDAPQCASPVLRRYTIRLNDRWDATKRQTLKPYLLRMIGTGGDGKDEIRERIAAKWVTEKLLPDWLRLAGMEDQLAALEAVEPGNWPALRKTLYAVRTAAWEKRDARREEIRRQVLAHLTEQQKPHAVAAAAADADAVADAVAAAVADADAVAVADAVAAAVAVAVADADAVAAAAAVAVAVPSWDTTWNAAYRAARKVYDKAYKESDVFDKIKALGAAQSPLALELLDLLIEADEANA